MKTIEKYIAAIYLLALALFLVFVLGSCDQQGKAEITGVAAPAAHQEAVRIHANN